MEWTFSCLSWYVSINQSLYFSIDSDSEAVVLRVTFKSLDVCTLLVRWGYISTGVNYKRLSDVTYANFGLGYWLAKGRR